MSMSELIRDLRGLDLLDIERIEDSHLGPYYTRLTMRNGETVTVGIEKTEILARLVKRSYGNIGAIDEE